MRNNLLNNIVIITLFCQLGSVPNVNQDSYEEKGLRYYGPTIWKSLLHVKARENLKTFKGIIKNWNGISCDSWVF